ncbi:beta-hexosaminidase [Larkinella punicea]|uniref:beta-N-acetylhexosaminidase n=1 Tax=Larkinella punicea TaxID=2315727 RepID=A0A368JNX8_9BACT|nr:beta-hexosaminidase [Larkinella punicea]
MYRKSRLVVLLVILSVWNRSTLHAQAVAERYAIIPYPTSLTPKPGQVILTPETGIVIPKSAALFRREADFLRTMLETEFGKPLAKAVKPTATQIIFQYDAGLTAPEGYRLTITPKTVNLTAKEPAGMFRAIQTLRQLMPVTLESRSNFPIQSLVVPAVQIEDQPAYAWRGMHLDVSRHFFSMAYLRKFIDLLALYKFNTFHLHLTDDQGWRIEIRKYPKLTEVGAWRTFNNQDSVVLERAKTNPDFALPSKHLIQKDGKTLYGGFYTQAEMKQLIAYAADRHIDIVPEIDMPGHLAAAIKAYPFLSCTGKEGWGKDFSVPICPCNETTYEFTQAVLDEIMALFPSRYVHLGADEVEKTTWAQSDACKVLMQREGLKDVNQLQSYFVHRMEKYVQSKGKKLLVWDDALEGGINASATVMYWRSWVKDAPVKAVKNGNPVVMTPVNTLYFDVLPNKNSLDNVYHFNPIPAGLTASEATAIQGAQANIWTEYIPSENRVDYMAMPRMTALAEAIWTKENRYDDYLQRLKSHYARLDALNVHYRLPDLSGFTEENVYVDKALFTVQKPANHLVIRYRTDGLQPDSTSTVLPEALPIMKPTTLTFAAFTPGGLKGDTYTARFRQQALAEPVTARTTQPGWQVHYYAGSFKNSKGMASATVTDSLTTRAIQVPAQATAPSFGLRFWGYLAIPETGVYSFFLTCDDGGVLRIANREVVDNDGQHGPIEKSGQVALKAGLHPVELDFIEGGGGYTLKLTYSKGNEEPREVPSNWLRH